MKVSLCVSQQEKLYRELMEVALKKQSEIQQIIVSAIASERHNVLQLASDFQFDGIALCAFYDSTKYQKNVSFQFSFCPHIKVTMLDISLQADVYNIAYGWLGSVVVRASD